MNTMNRILDELYFITTTVVDLGGHLHLSEIQAYHLGFVGVLSSEERGKRFRLRRQRCR